MFGDVIKFHIIIISPTFSKVGPPKITHALSSTSHTFDCEVEVATAGSDRLVVGEME